MHTFETVNKQRWRVPATSIFFMVQLPCLESLTILPRPVVLVALMLNEQITKTCTNKMCKYPHFVESFSTVLPQSLELSKDVQPFSELLRPAFTGQLSQALNNPFAVLKFLWLSQVFADMLCVIHWLLPIVVRNAAKNAVVFSISVLQPAWPNAIHGEKRALQMVAGSKNMPTC